MPDPLTNAHSWLTLSEVLGTPMPPDVLLANVRQIDRAQMLVGLAQIAAVLEGSPGEVHGAEARAWTHDRLIEAGASPTASDLQRRVARTLSLATVRQRAIAHPLVIFFLQAIALSDAAAEGGRLTNQAELAFLMLAANDHAPGWLAPPMRPRRYETIAARLCYYGLFNRNDDPLRELARTAMLSEFPPRRGPIAAIWSELQVEAFGTSFDDYVGNFLAPLFLFSRLWRGEEPPVLDRRLWFPVTQVPEALRDRWLEAVTLPLDDAVAAARQSLQTTGLPRVPAVFFRKPFLAIAPDRLVPLSPASVSAQLDLAPWGALNQAARARGFDNAQWSSAFGETFERWCRALALEAKASEGFRDEVPLSAEPGDPDEIEDLVFVQGSTVVLASVKAPVFAEKNLKDATSVDDVTAWLRRFFWADRDKAHGHRGGAIRVLDRVVSRLRAGAFEDRGIARDSVVLPLIVTFDDVGESPALYAWLDQRCKDDRVLSWRNGVRPVTLATSSTLELLLAAAARTGSVCDLVTEKINGEWRRCTSQEFLLQKVQALDARRLPSLVARFERISRLIGEFAARAAEVASSPQ
jgi:hypothetical protein